MPRKSLQGRTCGVSRDGGRARALQQSRRSTALRLSHRTDDCLKRPTLPTGPCPLTVAGPYAAWMPRKSLQGRTCGVSRDGGRARAPAARPQIIRCTTDLPAQANRKSRWPAGAGRKTTREVIQRRAARAFRSTPAELRKCRRVRLPCGKNLGQRGAFGLAPVRQQGGVAGGAAPAIRPGAHSGGIPLDRFLLAPGAP
ncbi:hypothetical protein CPBF367_01920 [Xanthomonas arboricola pv. juglandis]|nr:hypothetical protein CPBF367_01920 [Xanthomonas arboricola pv. juglandis]